MDLSLWAKYTSREKERKREKGGEAVARNADDIVKLRGEVMIRVLIRNLFFSLTCLL